MGALLCAWLAVAPGAPGSSPRVDFTQAVAEARVAAARVDLSRSDVVAVVFDRVGRCWTVRFQVPNAKGGTLEVDVCEDGRRRLEPGE